MSTNDVPGAKAQNNDELAMGCWAETSDGSYIFVQSTENDEVIFSMFDTSTNPVTEWRDKMPADEFKTHFSWDTNNSKSVKWTWHDKTPFPWDLIISKGARDGALPAASAYDQLTAAARVAKSMGLSGSDLDPDTLQHLMEQKAPRSIMSNIQKNIDQCPVDKPNKKLKKLIKKTEKLDAKIAKEMA